MGAVMDRTPEQVRALREQTAQSANLCADCFQPLAPNASATMVRRPIRIPAIIAWPGRAIPEHDNWIYVPICLQCSLLALQEHAEADVLNLGVGPARTGAGPIRRLAAIPMRGLQSTDPVPTRDPLPKSKWVCCADCLRLAANTRNRRRRRVQHAEQTCVVCRQRFVPKRTDAVTCSNRCRQQAHRQRLANSRPRSRNRADR